MDNLATGKQNKQARFIMHSAALSGRISMLAFVVFIWMGPFDVIDISLPRQGWFFWDLLLSSLFFVQHSVMIRQGVRAQMARFIAPYYQGAIFTLASSFALIVVILFWQPSHIILIEPSGIAQWMVHILFLLAAAGTGWGAWALKSFDPFGVKPIKAQLSGKPLRAQPFTIKGPYLWVRHPLYFFVLVMIWCRADLTADRLLFNLTWTAWIFIGTLLEEKDLVNEFGDLYQSYQKQVPMLIPWKGFKKNR